ncbi:4-hydroxy-3-methylbut-2-enyl diphosphate reductase IspH [Staphylococcus epidermidis]
MARKYNLDKVSNYLLTQTKLSADECHKVLDVVEEQFSQNIRQQKKDELAQKSQRDRRVKKMFEENRIVK